MNKNEMREYKTGTYEEGDEDICEPVGGYVADDDGHDDICDLSLMTGWSTDVFDGMLTARAV